MKERWLERLFKALTFISTIIGLLVLVILLIDVFKDGLPRLSWKFITSFPSRNPDEAGILPALVGSAMLLILTALFAFPIGVAAGIYLEEYASDNFFTRLIEINIANLAGIPSIIYGLLGLEIFVRALRGITGGRSIFSGALTMSLLVLPIIIVSSREAIRAVPRSIREAGYALGATKWQVVRDQILPVAMPGILTGTILALSRAIGETAPLITIGALAYIAFLPPLSLKALQSPFTVLPIQIFNWVSRPQEAFHANAAAAIIVLLVLLLSMNAAAIYLRNRFQVRFE